MEIKYDSIRTGIIGSSITSIVDVTNEIEKNMTEFKEETENKFKVIDANIIQYSQNTNNHLENIEKQLQFIEYKNENEFAEIKHSISQSIKSICEYNCELNKSMANHHMDVMKLFHRDILEFVCQCTTPLYKLVYDEMSDIHKELKRMLFISVSLAASSICFTIIVILLIVLG